MNEQMKTLAAQVSKMTDAQRAAIAARFPVVTIEQHVISPRNTCLVTLQADRAITIIGGFRQWIAHGRAVRKGEKAIYILRPCPKGRKAGADAAPGESTDGAEQHGPGMFFKAIPVFDVTQTDALQAVPA
ncbi:ArdC-like ssDNA-binding domain-containing protein [Polaromonas sp.]|uniref:ArdC-like ssDNA-binding domain-containing protein n=1 Tax=Polaromonas sp. TaxID=1869339 RepID=UPI003562191A